MLRKLLGSVNTRFLLFFLGAFVLSMIISAVVLTSSVQGTFRMVVRQALENRAEHVRDLAEQENIPVAKAVEYLSAADIRIEIYPDAVSLPVTLTSLELDSLQRDAVVLIENSHKTLQMKGVIFMDNQYLVLSPRITGDAVSFYTTVQRMLIFIPLILGALLIIIVTYTVIKPINEISAAAQEVARGNFDVAVQVRGYDEITELSKNFNMMVAELQSIEFLRKDFVSNVSHEFKTPITSLKGYVKLLKNQDLPEEKRQEFYDIIISESDRLANLSANLLKLAELENNRDRIADDNFSLAEQLRDTIILLQSEWEKKNLDLELYLDDVDFVGDKDLLYQVWINLFSNAVNYTPEQGQITVKLEQQTESVVVQVTDTGEGMTAEEQQKIFQRFYQADRSRNKTGAGLGLSIARKIVEIHGGTISVESVPGEGTTFRVELPRKREKEMPKRHI